MTESEAINDLKMTKCTRFFIPSNESLDMAIQALEKIQQYRAIGTIDEFKAFKEKNEPKEIWGNEYNPVYIGDTVNGLCPICNTKFVCITPRFYKANNYGYCKECGQKLDWE